VAQDSGQVLLCFPLFFCFSFFHLEGGDMPFLGQVFEGFWTCIAWLMDIACCKGPLYKEDTQKAHEEESEVDEVSSTEGAAQSARQHTTPRALSVKWYGPCPCCPIHSAVSVGSHTGHFGEAGWTTRRSTEPHKAFHYIYTRDTDLESTAAELQEYLDNADHEAYSCYSNNCNRNAETALQSFGVQPGIQQRALARPWLLLLVMALALVAVAVKETMFFKLQEAEDVVRGPISDMCFLHGGAVGQGHFTWVDGRSYEGSYNNDQKDGFGTKEGKQHGAGTFVVSWNDIRGRPNFGSGCQHKRPNPEAE